jgi:hypothetical protein
LEDNVVENSKYLKSIGYENSFNEGDPILIREKKEEAKEQAKAEEKKVGIFDDLDASRVSGAKAKQVAANKEFAEKYGENAAVARAISANFEAIANELKSKGIFIDIDCK